MKPSLQSREIDPEAFAALASPKEKIAFILQYGVLAPSTHNSQPWRFTLGENYCDIYRDDAKPIVYADPHGRDLYISFGCLIENIVIAAQYFKVFDRVEYMVTENRIARVYFKELGKTPALLREENMKHLVSAILYRVTARGLFEDEPVDTETETLLRSIKLPQDLGAVFLHTKEEIGTIAELTRRGLLIAYRNPKFRKEMSRWLNHSLSSKPIGIPGYSLRMPFLLSFVFPHFVRWFNIGKQLGVINYRTIASAPEAVVITARENGPRAWMDVGRYAERLMLEANAAGYKTSIFTAAIEMGDLHKELQAFLKTSQIPQFIIVIGKLDYQQKPNLRYAAQVKIVQ